MGRKALDTPFLNRTHFLMWDLLYMYVLRTSSLHVPSRYYRSFKVNPLANYARSGAFRSIFRKLAPLWVGQVQQLSTWSGVRTLI